MIDRKTALINYLQSCIAVGDWHGVRDAAVDIEILEAVDKQKQPIERVDDEPAALSHRAANWLQRQP